MASHRIEVPPPVWNWAVKLSGQQNPATFLRNVLIERALSVIPSFPSFDEPQNLDQPNNDQPNNKSLEDRKAVLNCTVNVLDQNFAAAWAWACDSFDGEDELVTFLEGQVALEHGPMTNPRGVIIRRWMDAGSPS